MIPEQAIEDIERGRAKNAKALEQLIDDVKATGDPEKIASALVALREIES